MTREWLIALDLGAIFLLVFGLYFPRYRRRDMVVAITGVNVGVLAVTVTLVSVDVGVGLGLGLFGVLSIIRLRSAELDQEEIAYYFAALAIGLLGGIVVDSMWISPVLMGVILVTLFFTDHPQLFGAHRHQLITLDAAIADEAELESRLSELLNAKIQRIRVRKLDFVNDSTVVDVRFKVR